MGFLAGSVRHVFVHTMWPSAVNDGSERGLDVNELMETALLCKAAPCGFFMLAILLYSGLSRLEAAITLSRLVEATLLTSAAVGLVLGPHCSQPAAAYVRHRLSTLALMRQYLCLCEASARHIVSELLPISDGINAAAQSALLSWSGRNKPIWVWSCRTCSLLHDQAPLIGLNEPSALVGVAALLRRQLLGAEEDILRCLESARKKLLGGAISSLKLRGVGGTLEPLTLEGIQPALDLLTVGAAALTMHNDNDGRVIVPIEEAEDVEQQGEDRPEHGDEHKMNYSIAELHAAYQRFAELSPLAIPSADLATTLTVAKTSRRPFSSCLGCILCCRHSQLQSRLKVDASIRNLHSERYRHPEDTGCWVGSCPMWSEFTGLCNDSDCLLRDCGPENEDWLRSLLLMTKVEDAATASKAGAPPRQASVSEISKRCVINGLCEQQELKKEQELFIQRFEDLVGKDQLRKPSPTAAEKNAENAVYAFTHDVARRASGSSSDCACLGYACVCLIRRVLHDGYPTTPYCDFGLRVLASRLVPDSEKEAGKSRTNRRVKSAILRARRILVAALRSRYLCDSERFSERSAFDTYILTTEWWANIGSAETTAVESLHPDRRVPEKWPYGANSSLLEPEESLCRRIVHIIGGKPHGERQDGDSPESSQDLTEEFEQAVAEVRQLRVCDSGALRTLLGKVLRVVAEVEAQDNAAKAQKWTGQEVATKMEELLAWVDAERLDLEMRMEKRGTKGQRSSVMAGYGSVADSTTLQAGLALGFQNRDKGQPAALHLLATGQAAAIASQHFGLGTAGTEAVAVRSPTPPGVCLGAVLLLLRTVNGADGPKRLLQHGINSLHRQLAWRPFMALLKDGEPRDFMAALAAGGGERVPWAPTPERSGREADVMHSLLRFLLRVMQSRLFPPPPESTPDVFIHKCDATAAILKYLGRKSKGLVDADDAMWLIEAVTGEACDTLTYTESCAAFRCQPRVGITVDIARMILDQLSEEQKRRVYTSAGFDEDNVREVTARAEKQHMEWTSRVETYTMAAWGFSDSVALWVTYFFGSHTAMEGKRLQGTGGGFGQLLNWRQEAKSKRRLAALRGLLALQSRPQELARAWRAAVDRGQLVVSSVLNSKPHSKANNATKLGMESKLLPTPARHAAVRVSPDTAVTAKALQQAEHNRNGSKKASEEEAPPTELPFQDGFCHSRTVMVHGGLCRDEAKNLAALRIVGKLTGWESIKGWVADSYAWPSLLLLAGLSVMEAALFALLPTFLYFNSRNHDGAAKMSSMQQRVLSPADAALAAGTVLCALYVGQAVGSYCQYSLLETVQHERLPARGSFVASTKRQWEADCLSTSVLHTVGALLWAIAWGRIPVPLVDLSLDRVNSPGEQIILRLLLLTFAAFALGACRPQSETALRLRPRRGHEDGRRDAPTLAVAYALRIAMAAIGVPMLYYWAAPVQEMKSDWSSLGDSVDSPVERLRAEGLVGTGAALDPLLACAQALDLLCPFLFGLPFILLVPWSCSVNHERPYANPVRRALHYRPVYVDAGKGGPPLEGRPVVTHVTTHHLTLRWPGPRSTRTLKYDVEVSIENSRWLSAEAVLDIKWHISRNHPACLVPCKSMPYGRTMRFRVRCAPEAFVGDAMDAESPWGPWSQPSLIINKPSKFRPPRLLRPLITLLWLPLGVLDRLLIFLPLAWLSQVGHRSATVAGKIWRAAPLLAIFPLVMAHAMLWAIPRTIQKRMLSTNLLTNTESSRSWHVTPVIIICGPLLLIHAVLFCCHQLSERMSKGRRVEMMAFGDEFGWAFDVTAQAASRKETKKSEAREDCSSGGNSSNPEGAGDVSREDLALRMTPISHGFSKVAPAIVMKEELKACSISPNDFGHMPKLCRRGTKLTVGLAPLRKLANLGEHEPAAGHVVHIQSWVPGSGEAGCVASILGRRVKRARPATLPKCFFKLLQYALADEEVFQKSISSLRTTQRSAQLLGGSLSFGNTADIYRLHRLLEGKLILLRRADVEAVTILDTNPPTLSIANETAVSFRPEADWKSLEEARRIAAAYYRVAAQIGVTAIIADGGHELWEPYHSILKNRKAAAVPLFIISTEEANILEAHVSEFDVVSIVTHPGDDEMDSHRRRFLHENTCEVDVSWTPVTLGHLDKATSWMTEREWRKADAPVLSIQHRCSLRGCATAVTSSPSSPEEPDEEEWTCRALVIASLLSSATLTVPFCRTHEFRVLGSVRGAWQTLSEDIIWHPTEEQVDTLDEWTEEPSETAIFSTLKAAKASVVLQAASMLIMSANGEHVPFSTETSAEKPITTGSLVEDPKAPQPEARTPRQSPPKSKKTTQELKQVQQAKEKKEQHKEQHRQPQRRASPPPCAERSGRPGQEDGPTPEQLNSESLEGRQPELTRTLTSQSRAAGSAAKKRLTNGDIIERQMSGLSGSDAGSGVLADTSLQGLQGEANKTDELLHPVREEGAGDSTPPPHGRDSVMTTAELDCGDGSGNCISISGIGLITRASTVDFHHEDPSWSLKTQDVVQADGCQLPPHDEIVEQNCHQLDQEMQNPQHQEQQQLQPQPPPQPPPQAPPQPPPQPPPQHQHRHSRDNLQKQEQLNQVQERVQNQPRQEKQQQPIDRPLQQQPQPQLHHHQSPLPEQAEKLRTPRFGQDQKSSQQPQRQQGQQLVQETGTAPAALAAPGKSSALGHDVKVGSHPPTQLKDATSQDMLPRPNGEAAGGRQQRIVQDDVPVVRHLGEVQVTASAAVKIVMPFFATAGRPPGSNPPAAASFDSVMVTSNGTRPRTRCDNLAWIG
eukprot:TRINITY_DN6970_c0_g1_i1.p1 TRINITY_DN6970_c0_g1~~TRINITY_DN6970_c0_g1_i1.p1  ORF type:complete len:3251 (-),score=667.62 TRINITY_DN6970_c0_g1_i1:184-8541(-)